MDLSRQGVVMGILNTTPDSFSDGGSHPTLESALSHARLMITEGAAIIDIGGESTRPGSLPVTADEERKRTVPIISALRQEWQGWISIDTMKASVAAAALDAGADVVNDVSGLTADPDMQEICARSGCAIIVMHMRGTPMTMQAAPQYEDVVAEISGFFRERYKSLTAAGISPEAICFDPGVGFGKKPIHNAELLRALDQLATHDRPLLLGVSRKSFIGRLLGDADPQLREWPTVALTAFAREKGVMLHRVHSVRENVQALRMMEAVLADPGDLSDGSKSGTR